MFELQMLGSGITELECQYGSMIPIDKIRNLILNIFHPPRVFTVSELKQMAKSRGIPRYSTKRKAELEEALGLPITGRRLPPKICSTIVTGGSGRSFNGINERKLLNRIYLNLINEPKTKMRLELETRIAADYASNISDIKLAGGRKLGYDIMLITTSGRELKIEVKSNKKALNVDCDVRPWVLGVQYLNKYIGKHPIPEIYGRELIRQFYIYEVIPFAKEYYPDIQLGEEHSQSYITEMSKSQISKNDPISQFLKAIKVNANTHGRLLYQRWKFFLNNYLRRTVNTVDLQPVADLAKSTIEAKDLWLILPASGVDLDNYHIVSHISYTSITYDNLFFHDNDQAYGFRLLATRDDKNTQTTTPLTVKYHWKNGSGILGIALLFA